MEIEVIGDVGRTIWNGHCGMFSSSRLGLPLHLSKKHTESMADRLYNKEIEDRQPVRLVLFEILAERILRLLQVSAWLRSG